MSCVVAETRFVRFSFRSESESASSASVSFAFSFSVSKSHTSETSVSDSGIRSGFRNRVEKKTVSPAAQTPNCSPPFFLPPARGASSHVDCPTPPFARCAGTTPSASITRHRRSETKPPRPSTSPAVSRVSKRPSSKPTTTSPTSISGKQTPTLASSHVEPSFRFESSSSSSVEVCFASRLASRKRNSRRYVACAAAETPSAQKRSFSKCDAAAGDAPHRAICLPSAKCRCSRERAHGVFTADPSGKKERALLLFLFSFSTSSASSYAGSADA
mmetsp:Transcript_11025/g.47069  ORF Transcript_11025/g.47069 Transcript_11025/m.47069 type:complete len:273 (+) Transcript_11025:3348-4166(+)